jgi:hypothetical protein
MRQADPQVDPGTKNVQVKKTPSDQNARVPQHGCSLSLFNPVIGLVDLLRQFIEAKKQTPKRK